MLVRSQGISLRKLVELSLYCRILSAYLLNNKLSPTESQCCYYYVIKTGNRLFSSVYDCMPHSKDQYKKLFSVGQFTNVLCFWFTKHNPARSQTHKTQLCTRKSKHWTTSIKISHKGAVINSIMK